MKSAEVKALRKGDSLYRVEDYLPLTGADRKYAAVEYVFDQKCATEHQLKFRDRVTILLTQAQSGRQLRVAAIMLENQFERDPVEAVKCYIERTRFHLEQEKRHLKWKENELVDLEAWARQFKPSQVRR